MTTQPEDFPTWAAGFVAHLRPRDRPASALARDLLARGWEVREAWGPMQMDVWGLRLARGDWQVRFGVERGYADAALAWHAAGADDQPVLIDDALAARLRAL